MTTPPWVPTTHPVRDGEQVKANVTNRITGELRQRTDYLKKRLDDSRAGSSLIIYDAPLDVSCKVSQPVYFDVSSGTYKPALAKLDYDSVSGAFVPNPSCFVEGIVILKVTGTRGDIAEVGMVDLDWTESIGTAGNTTAEGGAYYLSGVSAGKITKQKPPVSILVALLHGDSTGTANVTLVHRDVLEAHVHYAFTLTAEPAGEIVCGTADVKNEFITVNPDRPGWLPASYFGAAAPAGAVYGYNLEKHPALQRVWPPLPTGSAYLEFNGVGVAPGRFTVDMNGLWWHDECFTRAPWAMREGCADDGTVSSSSSSSSESSSSSSDENSCVSDPMLAELGFNFSDPTVALMRLYFTKMVFKTDNSAVTSLTSRKSRTPVKFFNCDNVESKTGDLKADLIVAPDYPDVASAPFKAIQKLESGTDGEIKATRLSVVTGLIPGDFITLTGAQDENNRYVGPVTISNDPAYLQTRDIAVALVALDGIRQDNRNGLFWLAFPTGKVSSFRGQIDLPTALVAEGSVLRLQLWIIALDTNYVSTPGAVPALKMSHRIAATPTEATALPTTDSTLVALGTDTVLTNQYFKVVTYDIDVTDGDKVFFTIQRDDLTEYGDIGLLRMTAQLVRPEE